MTTNFLLVNQQICKILGMLIPAHSRVCGGQRIILNKLPYKNFIFPADCVIVCFVDRLFKNWMSV